jgi:putative transposase
VALDLKAIYQAATLAEAAPQLGEFEQPWGKSYRVIGRSWRANWARVEPMFGYPSEIRRAVYTANTIESLNMRLRKIMKNRWLFPNDEAVFKLMYLGLRNISNDFGKLTWPISAVPFGPPKTARSTLARRLCLIRSLLTAH